MHFRDALRLTHAAPDLRLFPDGFVQHLLGWFLQRFEGRDVRDDPNAHLRRRERDHPKPTAAPGDDADERARDAFVPRDIFVVGEDGKLLQVRVVFLELEILADHRAAAAAIEHDSARLDLSRRQRRSLMVRPTASPMHEVQAFDARLLGDGRAVLRGVVEEHFVELRARHLVGAFVFREQAVFEGDLDAVRPAGGGDLGAVFRQETRIEFLDDPKPLEGFHAMRQERFADMEAGKFFAFEHDDLVAETGEKRWRRCFRPWGRRQ